jgi:hypothetical protein
MQFPLGHVKPLVVLLYPTIKSLAVVLKSTFPKLPN